MDRPLRLLLNYEEAAAALSMTRAALRDLVYKGRGPVVTKIGRRTYFSVEDLEAFVAQHRVPETPGQKTSSPPNKRRRGRPSVAEQLTYESRFGA